MKKLLGGLFILGAVAGGVVAVRGYLRGGGAAKDVVQVTFDDGSARSFASNTPEGEEFADLARKLVEMGV
ncbi:MAG: hypothetical protein H0U91_02865 [Rubrobacter sp.]|nr:hypothetical protein [Rubrobacter sp.]MDQ3360767.1 hypothetical protein [Actinomycetota bacterium]MDQ3376150.1 hypothetical protein [Actinomycetota bacterium]